MNTEIKGYEPGLAFLLLSVSTNKVLSPTGLGRVLWLLQLVLLFLVNHDLVYHVLSYMIYMYAMMQCKWVWTLNILKQDWVDITE